MAARRSTSRRSSCCGACAAVRMVRTSQAQPGAGTSTHVRTARDASGQAALRLWYVQYDGAGHMWRLVAVPPRRQGRDSTAPLLSFLGRPGAQLPRAVLHCRQHAEARRRSAAQRPKARRLHGRAQHGWFVCANLHQHGARVDLHSVTSHPGAHSRVVFSDG